MSFEGTSKNRHERVKLAVRSGHVPSVRRAPELTDSPAQSVFRSSLDLNSNTGALFRAKLPESARPLRTFDLHGQTAKPAKPANDAIR